MNNDARMLSPGVDHLVLQASSTPGFGSARCFALPTASCAFPLSSCALPFTCSPLSPLSPPTAFRTLPSTCLAEPLSRSAAPSVAMSFLSVIFHPTREKDFAVHEASKVGRLPEKNRDFGHCL